MTLPLLFALAAALPPADSGGVEIAGFRPESRTLAPGAAAVSELTVRNRSDEAREVWIGYSVQDAAGRWHDAPAHPLTLAEGSLSEPQRKELHLPVDAAAGSYRVVMAVWSAEPGSVDARRLASEDQPVAFRVRGERWPLADDPDGPWRAASHALGRGMLQPEAVWAQGKGFRLELLPGRCNGAEVRTAERFGFGEYTARMRTPLAPGSIAAWFLYEGMGEGSDEIDIEIHNDGSRRVLLTAWRGGKPTREATAVLPFDPAAAPHDYTIRWSPRELVLLADGEELARWTSGIPQRPMKVMANIWWPKWLPCEPLTEARELEVEWVRTLPATAR